MRRVIAVVIAVVVAVVVAVLALLAPASATPPPRPEFTSPEAVLRWIYGYRVKPDPAGVPTKVRALVHLGAFKDPETSGIYVGFIAGVIGSNPAKAEELINKMLNIPPEGHWILVRAIAYSGHPEWKQLLRKFADRMPARGIMIHEYLAGRLPTLDDVALAEASPTMFEKLGGYFKPAPAKRPTLDSNPEMLDTLWGFYFATGSYRPVLRIIALLPWSKDRDNVERLTVGSMARYTLATNASRDAQLLGMLRNATPHQPKNVAPILVEVIRAAETVDTTSIRKDSLAAIDEYKRKGPAYKRDVSFWGHVGVGALALGCVAAAALGQIEFGLPCVVGGGLSSAALTFWEKQQ